MNNQFDVTVGELLQRASKIGRLPSRVHRFFSVNNTTEHNLASSLSDYKKDNSSYPVRSTRIIGGNHRTPSENSNITNSHKGKDVFRRNTLKDYFKCKRSYVKREGSFSNSGNRASGSNGTNTNVTNHSLNIQNTETGADDLDEDVVVGAQDSGCARTNLVRDKSNPRDCSIFINDNLFKSSGTPKNFRKRTSQVLNNNNRNNNMGISTFNDRKRSMTDYQWLLEDGMDDLFENLPWDEDSALGLRLVEGQDHNLIGLEENEPLRLKYVREVNKSESQNNLTRKPFSSMNNNSQNCIGNSQKEYEFKYFRKIERNENGVSYGQTKEKSTFNNTAFKRSSSKRKISENNIGVIRKREEFKRNSQQELIRNINPFSSSLPGSQLLESLPSSNADIDKDEVQFVSLCNEKHVRRASKTQLSKTSANEVPTIIQMPFEKISQQEPIRGINSFSSSSSISQLLESLPSSNADINMDEVEFVSLHNEKYIKRASKTQVSTTPANEVPVITQMPFEKTSQQELIGRMNSFSSYLPASQILETFPSPNGDIDNDEVEFVSLHNEKYIKRASQTQVSTTSANEVSTMAQMPVEKISKQGFIGSVNPFSSSLPASQILESFPSSNGDIDKDEGHDEEYIQRAPKTQGSTTSANGIPQTSSISDGKLSYLSGLPLKDSEPNSTNICIDNNQVEIVSLCNDRCIKCGFPTSNGVPPITQTPSISEEKANNSEGIEVWNSDIIPSRKVLNTSYNEFIEIEADTIPEEKIETSTTKIQILENIVLKNEYEWCPPVFPQQSQIVVDPLISTSKEGDNIGVKPRKLSRNIKERHILKADFNQNSWDKDERRQSPGKIDYKTDVEYLRSFLEDKLRTIARYLYQFQNNLEGKDNNYFNNTILNGLSNPNEDTLLKDLESQDIFSQSFTFTPILVDRSKIKCSQTSISQSEQVDRPNDDMFSRSIDELLKDTSLISKGVYDVNIPSDVRKMFILRKISDTFIKLLDDVGTQRVPVLCSKYYYGDKLRKFDENKMIVVPFLRSNFSKISLENRRSRSKFNLVVFLMGKSADLLINNNFSTKRELYYQIKSFVKNQCEVNNAVTAISMLLDEPPWDFGILGASKGLVYGDLTVTLSEKEVVNCNVRGGSLIPQDVVNITKLESNASFILVVEKDSIFQKLLDENLPNMLPKSFILVTGKGFADFNTSLFIKKLWQILYIPVFLLVDADPYGIEIMLTYRFGSTGSPHLSEHLAIPSLKWIGVHPKEIIPLNIARQPLTEIDQKKIRTILARPYINFVPKIKEELEVMLANNFKAEIEGIMKGNNYLRNYYIPSKICAKDFL